MKLENVSVLLMGMMVTTLALWVVYCLVDSILLLIISVLLLAATLVAWLVLWRCPHCRGHLGRRLNSTYCHHCGKPL